MDNNCVFCDRTKFEERIIAENDDWYVIASLGQIKAGYTLIIPKRHVLCIGTMSENEISDVEALTLIARDAIQIEYEIRPIIFEHGIVGQTIQHAHLHLLPAQIHLYDKIRKDFPETAVDMIIAPNAFEILRRVYASNGDKYLLWSVPMDSWSRTSLVVQIAWNPPAPPQYLRLIAAELTGHPEYGNWRNIDPKLDKLLWQETVTRLKPYF